MPVAFEVGDPTAATLAVPLPLRFGALGDRRRNR
jgi:hypothetical protein